MKNADPNYSTRAWPVVEAPGAWGKVYKDGKVFHVGWYRGTLHFAEDLVGQKVTVLLDAYMSRLKFYVDGKLVYARYGKNSYEKFYSIQPIPITFTVKDTVQVVAFRVETMLMTGVYQLPFEIRKFQKNDTFVSFVQFWGGEFRFIASFIVVFYGLFFLLVYMKTRATIYMIAGFSGIFIYPFYGLPSDMLIRFFQPETLQLLHYTGIGCLAAFHGFYAQFFYKFYPNFNRINLFLNLVFVGIFIGFNFHFDLKIFQVARKALFLYSLAVATHYIYILIRGVMRDRNAIILLIGEIVMWACSIHDTLLALGFIKSVSLLFFGTVVATAAILFVSSTIFANTYVENKKLIKGIEEVNRNLEHKVWQRTRELEEKSPRCSDNAGISP